MSDNNNNNNNNNNHFKVHKLSSLVSDSGDDDSSNPSLKRMLFDESKAGSSTESDESSQRKKQKPNYDWLICSSESSNESNADDDDDGKPANKGNESNADHDDDDDGKPADKGSESNADHDDSKPADKGSESNADHDDSKPADKGNELIANDDDDSKPADKGNESNADDDDDNDDGKPKAKAKPTRSVILHPQSTIRDQLSVSLETVGNVHCVVTNIDTEKKSELYRLVSSWSGPQECLRANAKEIMSLLLQCNATRCLLHLSPHASDIAMEGFPETQPVIYAKYTDNTFQTMDKIGMAGKILERYKSPQDRDSLFLLCSLGWIPVEVRKRIVESQKTLIENIIANQHTPEELKAYLSMFYGRRAADLGLRSNLYRQQIECSHQMLYNQDVPAEFLSRDVEGICADRKLVVRCANLGLSVLQKLLVDDNGSVLQVTHIHCTLSWNTGAQEDSLLSKVVAMNYMSDNAPWEDAVPDAAIPGAKTAAEIFSTDYNGHQIANGEAIVTGRLQKGAKEFILELLDTNEIIFSKKNQLENLLHHNNYTHHLEILGEINVWVHNVTKSIVIVHPPLSICMDCRFFISKQLGKRRFQLLEIMRLMVTSLKTGCKQVTLGDLPKTKDAIFASYVYEATTENFHQDRRVACALARDVLTDDSINACVQNGLDKASEESFIYNRRHLKEKKAQQDAGLAQRGSKKGVAGRSNDFYKLVWAANRASFLNVDKRQIQQSMMVGGIDPDATITQVCIEVDAILRGSKNNIAKLANWSNFEKKWIQGYIKEQFVAIRSKTLKNNTGNKLPKKAFDKQQNDALVSDLVEHQSLCWVRAGTPKDDEAKLIPDFASIVIESAEKWPKVPNTPKVVALFVDSTQSVVAGLKGRALKSNGHFELVKMRKIFVEGEMDENDTPKVWVVKQGGPKSLQPKGSSLGMTWVLCQLRSTAGAEKGKEEE